jgi:hypothetical protein
MAHTAREQRTLRTKGRFRRGGGGDRRAGQRHPGAQHNRRSRHEVLHRSPQPQLISYVCLMRQRRQWLAKAERTWSKTLLETGETLSLPTG